MKGKVWNKGLTKATSASVMKTSLTMKRRKIDNFSAWRDAAKRSGKIRSAYPELIKGGDLAELIGVILGDGHIAVFPRTECLTIVGTSTNKGFCERYAKIVEKVFDQKPSTNKRSTSNAVDVRIYQKHISSRIGIPAGAKGKLIFRVPRWILAKEEYIVRYLRGLYEAEGSLHFHPKTYTHKLLFSNYNPSLVAIAMRLLRKLGFHPHFSSHKVQLSQKDEVARAVKMLKFRSYNNK